MVSSKQFFSVVGIVLFWIAAIFSVLYVPYVFNLFKNKQSINVLMWSGVVDPKLFKQFEKETGIRVNASYFEGNEELIVKILATKGIGYDMIVPSDYAVSFFSQNGLLQKIDKTKLDFWSQIDPLFLGHSFDPNNDYSIPAEWYVLGLGVNKHHFSQGLPEASWKTLFEPQSPYYVGLLNDIRELATVGLLYRYGTLIPPTQEQLQDVKKLLTAQKQYVEAYTDFRGDFLLESGNCSVVLLGLSAVWKSVAREDAKIAFLLPKEGTLMGIENYAVPANSTKQDLVYQFMNFLFRLSVQKHNFEQRMFLSTRIDAEFIRTSPLLISCLEAIASGKAKPFENVFTEEQVNELSLAIKGLR